MAPANIGRPRRIRNCENGSAPLGLNVVSATRSSLRLEWAAARFFTSSSQASATALQLLAVDTEPPVSGAAGSEESPSRTSTRSIGTPSRSEATWASTV